MFKKFFTHHESVPVKLLLDGKVERRKMDLRIYGDKPYTVYDELPKEIQSCKDWTIETFIDGRFWIIQGGDGDVWNTYMEPFPGFDLRARVFGKQLSK